MGRRRSRAVAILEGVTLAVFALGHLGLIVTAGIFLIAAYGAMSWHGMAGESVGNPSPPVDEFRRTVSKVIWFSWFLAALYSIMIPMVRRRFDLATLGGSIYLATSILVEELFLLAPPGEDAIVILFPWYLMVFLLPAVAMWLFIRRLKSGWVNEGT